MTEEKYEVVKEVEVVLNVVKKYLNKKEDIPYAVLEEIINKLNEVKEDYKRTIDDFVACNSLVSKLERLFELVGTISTISTEDEEKLDNTISLLNDCVKVNRD